MAEQGEQGMEKELRFEVKPTVKELWQFLLYHANSGTLGLFNVLTTLMALFLLIIRYSELTVPYRLMLVFGALVFTVLQPCDLYRKARRQAKSPATKDVMLLTFDDAGLRVEQNDQQTAFTWEQIGRMARKPTMAILYMDRVHVFLLPRRVMGEQEEALYEMARQHLPKERRRRI